MKTTYLVQLAAIQRGVESGPIHSFTNKKQAEECVLEISSKKGLAITGTYQPVYELDKEELAALGVEAEGDLVVHRKGYYLGTDELEEHEVHLTTVY